MKLKLLKASKTNPSGKLLENLRIYYLMNDRRLKIRRLSALIAFIYTVKETADDDTRRYICLNGDTNPEQAQRFLNNFEESIELNKSI